MNDYSNFIGKILDKRYKILGLVGIGGMACVLRAQDLVMNRVIPDRKSYSTPPCSP